MLKGESVSTIEETGRGQILYYPNNLRSLNNYVFLIMTLTIGNRVTVIPIIWTIKIPSLTKDYNVMGAVTNYLRKIVYRLIFELDEAIPPI